MTVKRFRSGSGRLDANNLNKMVQAAQAVERFPAQGQHFRPRWYGPISCKVTAKTTISSGKWKYAVEEVLFSSPETFETATGGFTSDRVVNLAARDNTTTSHSGLVPATLQGFDLQTIPVGAVVACYVANNGDATNPNTVWFDRPGEFYGTCS